VKFRDEVPWETKAIGAKFNLTLFSTYMLHWNEVSPAPSFPVINKRKSVADTPRGNNCRAAALIRLSIFWRASTMVGARLEAS